jgi:hypothetical protein
MHLGPATKASCGLPKARSEKDSPDHQKARVKDGQFCENTMLYYVAPAIQHLGAVLSIGVRVSSPLHRETHYLGSPVFSSTSSVAGPPAL